MNNSKLDCHIVRDLLSLYHDDVVSDATKNDVEAHIEGCETCRAELDALRQTLPAAEQQLSTKKSFANMMRRQKNKRIITVITAVLIACAVLVGGYFALLTVACVSFDDKVEVLAAHVVPTEEGEKLFVIIDRPMYDGVLHYRMESRPDEDGHSIVLNFRKSLLGLMFDAHHVETLSYDINEVSNTIETQYTADELSEVRIGDRVIWNRAENADDHVPQYVYEYVNNDGFLIDYWDVNYDSENPQKSSVMASYTDGRNIIWDFEGNVISEYMSEADS